MKIALSLLIAICIAGCAAPKSQLRSAATPFKINAEGTDAQNQLEIEAKLIEVLDFCQPRLSGYEIKAENQASDAYWLAMSGLVAGSVIVPALAASSAAAHSAAIAGFSGWSGATNFASESLRTSGLSGATAAQTRNNIITSVRDQIIIAADVTKPFLQRRNALMMARADCVMYEISVPTIPGRK